jgi:NTE family protein
MPFGQEGVEETTGLALSGGGFRAALFHAGALWRLSELGALAGLARVSSVSGGSITAGVLAVKWSALRDAGFATGALIREVIGPLRSFCARTIDLPAIAKGVLLPFRSVAEEVQGAYAEHLFGERTLQDLPDVPRFVFNATNLSSGVGFRFSKPYAGDYRIGLLERPELRIATAVAASSAFPPVLSPVVLDVDPKKVARTPGADLHDRVAQDGIRLTDGGVYDNMGIETVWKRCRTVLVSDAGEPFAAGGRQASDWIRQTMRALTIIAHQARAQRRRALVQQYVAKERLGAYWGIQTEIDQYAAPGQLPVPREVTRRLSQLRTRLDRFDEREQCTLVNWGYAVSDAAMRTFVTRGAAPPAAWPYPKYPLDRPDAGAVAVDEALDLDPASEGP